MLLSKTTKQNKTELHRIHEVVFEEEKGKSGNPHTEGALLTSKKPKSCFFFKIFRGIAVFF